MGVRSASHARRSRAGFTLVEAMITVVIVLSLTAVAVPALVGVRDAQRVSSSARILEELTLAIHDPDSTGGSFRPDIVRYPGALSHLTKELVTTEQNSCGVDYRPGDVIPDKWRGAYVNRVITADGFPIGIGTVQNAMTRDHDHRTRPSLLRIHVLNVILEDAVSMDDLVDLGDGAATGTIRWGTADADGFVTMDYVMNVLGC